MDFRLAGGQVGTPLPGFAEEQGTEVAHRGGAAFFPAHACSIEALRDEALAAGFNRSGADLLAAGEVAWVVHAVLMVAEVLSLFPIDFAPPTAPAPGVELFPFR